MPMVRGAARQRFHERVVIADTEGFLNMLDPLHSVSIDEARPLPIQ
jgi:hypothetical protein